jgi:hypothetical protein
MSKLITNSELIKQEIAKLERTGSKDFQSLMRQVDGKYNVLQYNLAQLVASQVLTTHKTIVNLWGRGTGKTTSIGDISRQIARDMPRGVGAFVSPTYQFFLTKIIPSLTAGLELQGLYNGLHYFIGRKPPAGWNWPIPYQPPSKWDHFITFYTGFGYHLISQDLTGDGRGLNLDVVVSDESALLSKPKLDETVIPALRGSNRTAFNKAKTFGSQIHHTSMPITNAGRWILNLEEKQNTSKHIKVIRANCKVNLQNLIPGYLENAKTEIEPYKFDTEYLNKNPKKVERSFYGLLDEDKHGYNNFNYNYWVANKPLSCVGDADVDAKTPLLIGIDWGAVINSLVVCQHDQHAHELKALKSLYALGDRGEMQDDLASAFCKYYSAHPTKTVYMYYDNTGNVRTGNSRSTRADQFKKILVANGWTVVARTEGGTNPHHDKKHHLWEVLLSESNPSLPRFRINLSNSRDLLLSMINAQAKVNDKGVSKDKTSERRLSGEQRVLATDLSDAIDTIVFTMFNTKLRTGSYQSFEHIS